MAGRTYEEAKALYEAGQRNVSFDAGPVYGPRTYDATLIPDSYDYKVFNPAAQVNYGANLTQAQQIFKQATGLDLTGDGLNVVTGHIRQGDSPEQALKNLGDLGNYVKFSTDYNGGTSGGPAGPAGPDYSKTPGFWEASAGVTTPQATLQAVPNPLQGYQGGNATTSSIVDYLGSLGKPSDFASRKTLAEQAGIQNYTGTAAQNTQLLSMLRGATPPSPDITPKSFEKPPTVNVPGAGETGTAGTDSTASAKGTQVAQNVDSIIAAYAASKTAEQTQAGDLTKKLLELLPQTEGQSTMLANELAKPGGADELTRMLTTENGKLKTLIAEREALKVEQQGKPVTMNTIIGAQAQINAVYDSKILTQTAIISALQGDITQAKDDAQKAVDAKFKPILEKAAIYQAQLDALKPTLDEQEKKRAEAIQILLDQQKQALVDQKDAEKAQANYVYDMMGKYADAGILPTDSFSTIQSKIQGSRIYKQDTRLAGGGTGGSGGSGGGTIDYGTSVNPSTPTQLVDRNGKPIKLTATQVESVVGFQTALSQIQEAKNFINENNPDTGPISGRLSEITRLGNLADPNIVQLDALLSSIKANFMKAISGAAVSEAEVQRLSKFLPNINDTEQNLAIKLNQFESSLNQQKNTYFATLGAVNKQTQTSEPEIKTETSQTSTLPPPVQKSFWSKVGNFLFGND